MVKGKLYGPCVKAGVAATKEGMTETAATEVAGTPMVKLGVTGTYCVTKCVASRRLMTGA